MQDSFSGQYFLEIGLDHIMNDIFIRLKEATLSSKNPFHEGCIATINNNEVELRTVVLRKVLKEEQILIFHTDIRSPKIKQIENNNRVSWLFYDPQLRIQIRFKAIAEINRLDELTLKQWGTSRLESRKCYLITSGPSSEIEEPLETSLSEMDTQDLTEELLINGYQNFAVISTAIYECDWLFLHRKKHRRAKFIKENSGLWEGKWVQA